MIHDFKKPFYIITDGQDIEITNIELNEPCGNCYTEMCKLDAVYSRALKSYRESSTISEEVIEKAKEEIESKKSKSDDSAKDEKMTPDEVLSIISVSGISTVDAFDAMKKMLAKTKAKLNGEYLCSGANFDDIPYRIQKELFAVYFANFTDTSF